MDAGYASVREENRSYSFLLLSSAILAASAATTLITVLITRTIGHITQQSFYFCLDESIQYKVIKNENQIDPREYNNGSKIKVYHLIYLLYEIIIQK